MCMQCMATAMAAGATATGTRSFIAAKHFSWMTPKRLHRITVALIVAALAVSGVFVSGSSSKQPAGAAHHAPHGAAAR